LSAATRWPARSRSRTARGRGHKLVACPVKQEALLAASPLSISEDPQQEGVSALAELAPDLCVTAAFGQILSQRVLDIPKAGTVQRARVAAPRLPGRRAGNWCTSRRDEVRVVTTMMTDKGIDTGTPLCSAKPPSIGGDAGQLLARLSEIGARLLVETLEKIEAGSCPRVPRTRRALPISPCSKKR
jgi:methionyl-tRNA formyltransferase